MTLGFMIVIVSCTQKVQSGSNITKKPAWLKEVIVMAGSNQEAFLFGTRSGRLMTQENAQSQHSQTMQDVKEAHDLGGTYWITHLHKAFGIEVEKEQFPLDKELVDLCHNLGMRVGGYVGSTIGYETFLNEKSEAKDWLVPDYLGKPVVYSDDQYFRRRIYFACPGHIKYMKRIIKIGIEELGIDHFHFDNPSNQATPEICHHPLAIKQFRNFLRKKYTPKMLKERIGFSNVDNVIPPRYISPEKMQTFDDPVTQEWIDFRCQKLADYYGELGSYIHKLNPEVSFDINCIGGFANDGYNRAWRSGVDFPRLLAHSDVFELEGSRAYVTEDGRLLSSIRPYKIGRTFNNIVYNRIEGDSPIGAAESMAFNLNYLATPGISSLKSLSKYVKFYHENFEHYYCDTEEIADVAILRSFPSLAYSNYDTHQSTMLFEQVLIQAKIPFGIIFDNNLKDLSKYSVLVLANQECLRDDQLDLIRNFVKQGGGLVATENSSLYNEWRKRRPSFGLKDLFKVELPSIEGNVVRNQFDSGRVVYIPAIKPSIKRPPTAKMSDEYLKLPVNWEEIVSAVKWAAGNDLSVEVEAPLMVVMELTKQKDEGQIMLHLINFNATKDELVKNIGVSLKIPRGKQVQELLLLSPDREKDETLHYSLAGKNIIFTIPVLETYDLVVTTFK